MISRFKKLIVNTDGGARGNPGIAACAFVVSKDGEVIYKKGVFLGETTNNVAEYKGVLEAYKWILENTRGLEELVFKIDSELVVKQLNGLYKVRDKELFLLWKKVKEMEESIKATVSYVHIPRVENNYADSILNSVLNRVSRYVSPTT